MYNRKRVPIRRVRNGASTRVPDMAQVRLDGRRSENLPNRCELLWMVGLGRPRPRQWWLRNKKSSLAFTKEHRGPTTTDLVRRLLLCARSSSAESRTRTPAQQADHGRSSAYAHAHVTDTRPRLRGAPHQDGQSLPRNPHRAPKSQSVSQSVRAAQMRLRWPPRCLMGRLFVCLV